ncbi:hypothetical protein WJX72_006111 [[Myrmecia] bisecta]|uniref:tRNA (adenine(58)-N(1))-methyltransferase n=1 Tax=[Myrmecia] bisecta TaxID=41462 RepID=A0AAW1R769_9CHLO
MVLPKEAHLQLASAPAIAAGDLVIVYERYDSMKAVVVEPKKQFSNRFGNFNMAAWVGLPFGSKALAKPPSQGWVYLLAPTAELWTLVLRHRTQILYAADISLVCTFLELRPGCTVLESGTGSGSLTHSLARAIAPTGQVHTFEFHEQRCQAAADEFASNGLGSLVTIQHRDIEKGGFPDELAGRADGVFLDLPGPWNAVASAAQSLRPDGVFCSFSPCIEQVQRTCAALAKEGFYALRTMECLLRNYDLRTEKMITDLDNHPSMDPVVQGGGNSQAAQARKRKREQQQQKPTANGTTAVAAIDSATPSGSTAQTTQGGDKPAGSTILELLVIKPAAEARGHTGYLTFARKAVRLPEAAER